MIDVVAVKHLSGYCLWLQFEDGSCGEIDLTEELHGDVFEPLKDLNFFARVVVDPDLGTVAWPNGADFAPEFLCGRVHVAA